MMQKFFLGDMVIPLTCGSIECVFEMVSPTIEYDNCFHVNGMSVFETLYEKQPPFRFRASSHIGVIPLRIKNNIQFIMSLGGSISVIATASSTVSNSYILV